jgi:mannose-6-phosphate isomerase
MFYPLTFQPIFQQRVWGGRRLQALYGKSLPPGVPIGESWEITDRPGATSVVSNGPWAGRDLHWLMLQHGKAVLGAAHDHNGRFPLLVKIIDAREILSVQVHPPASLAAALGGEPKTELWFFTESDPEAAVYAGLKAGVTRAEFERKLANGSVAECLHQLKVKAGDALFLPAGRLHALGRGVVLFEIQQNSDTTYRVFDWNRLGLDGRPRQLHISEALASIDFNDFEPACISSAAVESEGRSERTLVDAPCFRVSACRLKAGATHDLTLERALVIGVVDGLLEVGRQPDTVNLSRGQFCLLPAALGRTRISAKTDSEYLLAQPV